MKQMVEKIGPQLQELGFEAMVVCGYMTDGEGKVHKITLGLDGKNPAYADGLRVIGALMDRWGQGQL